MNRTHKLKIRLAAVFITTLASPLLLAADYSNASSSDNYHAPTRAEQEVALSAAVKQMGGHKPETPVLYKLMLDRLERDFTNKGDFNYTEGQAWVGSSTNKFWLKGEASRVNGNTEDANIEAYYSHAISAYWDAQIGMRHDYSTGIPSRNWLGLGVKGLAPYLFDIDATAYVGSNGRSALRFKGEYDLLLTQRLVFTPEVELNAYGKNDPQRMLGSGLSSGSLTMRVRYEIRREVAPYVGVMWTSKFSGTANYARTMSEPVSDSLLIAGIRLWW